MRFTFDSNITIYPHNYFVERKVSTKRGKLRDSAIFKIHSTVLTTNIYSYFVNETHYTFC
jgi:hypothetical protein